MSIGEYNRLKEDETSRHLKVLAELQFRLSISQANCLHQIREDDGVTCLYCGLKLSKEHNEHLHKMQKEEANNNRLSY